MGKRKLRTPCALGRFGAVGMRDIQLLASVLLETCTFPSSRPRNKRAEEPSLPQLLAAPPLAKGTFSSHLDLPLVAWRSPPAVALALPAPGASGSTPLHSPEPRPRRTAAPTPFSRLRAGALARCSRAATGREGVADSPTAGAELSGARGSPNPGLPRQASNRQQTSAPSRAITGQSHGPGRLRLSGLGVERRQKKGEGVDALQSRARADSAKGQFV